MRMTKVLFVQDSLGTGGAERSNADLWYFLRSQGVSVKVVVLEHRKEGIENEILSNGFDVTFLNSGNFIAQAREIAEIIKDFKPQIVHSVLFRSIFPVRAVRHVIPFHHVESLVSCPYSAERLKDSKVNKWGVKFYKNLDRISHIRGTDRFIAITQEAKNHYQKHVKIPSSKISVISRGRKENPFLSQREKIRKNYLEEFNLQSNDLLFIHVGRQEFAKGHLTFLKAIKRADEELLKYNVKFIFCGRQGNATDEIKSYILTENIQSEIKFLGHRDDIYKILVASDVFVFPSLYEGLGGSLIEAQAAALPVICSDIRVFSEVVKKNGNALMFEVGNEKELADKLITMASSPQLREAFGKNSLKNFLENFLIAQIHEKMLFFFEQTSQSGKY